MGVPPTLGLEVPGFKSSSLPLFVMMSMYIFADDFQDDVGPVSLKKTKSTSKAKVKAKVQEEAKSKEPTTLKRKER